MRILGIDPGLQITGYGVIDCHRAVPALVDGGVIRLKAKAALEDRLIELERELQSLFDEHKPNLCAIEQLYAHYAHPRTAILMGHARGVILLVARRNGAEVESYPANRIKQSLVDKYFTWTPTRIEGIGLAQIFAEIKKRHGRAFPERQAEPDVLPAGGVYQWRAEGERHLFNPQTIHKLQYAVRQRKDAVWTRGYKIFKEYSALVNAQEKEFCTLRALLDSHHRVVGVLTQPDRPAGRGRELRASPVKLLAAERGVPVAQPQTLKTPEGLGPLREWSPDLLVVVAYGLILPAAALALPRLGCLNIHGSLLPRWRGAAPIQRALLAGDAETGITIMQLDEGLDTGPMLLERRRAIGTDDTAGDLHDALAELGASALLEAIDGLAAGTLPGRAQPSAGATYAPKIEKSEALIDWNSTATHIDRQIRAFNPWPVAETRLDGQPLRILRSRLLEASGRAGEPGSLLGLGDDGLRVACGEGVVLLRELQRAGRRPVPARDFANGVRIAGARLGA